MSDYAADLELACSAARSAGEVVMRYFRTDLAVEYKSADQPLTQADLAADRLLHDELKGARPDYGWLSEETRDGPDRLACERVWIVDPIDGTRSFIEGLPEFTISIGLVEHGVAVAGVVYNPARDELFAAARGGGARLDVDGRSQTLQVSTRSMDDQLTMLASRSEIAAGEFDPFHGGWRVEPAGSTAYKLAWIAGARGEAFVSRGPKSEWDICAGVLLISEAGGMVTDIRGAEPRFNNPDPYVRGIIATNSALHGALLERIAAMPLTRRLQKRAADDLHPGLDRKGEL